jgi:cytochrome b561/polyisoprenoid-binding protein YceI
MNDTGVPGGAGQSRYAGVAIVLHWAIALAILFMIGLGWYMGDLPDSAPLKENLYQFHKSVGITILVLTLARIAWRVMNPPPPLPAGMADWERGLSHGVHIAFYALMLAMPLTGWLYVSTAHEFDIPTVLFGVLSWPDLPGVGVLTNEAGHEGVEFVHSKLAWLALALLAMHVGGAIKHEIGAETGVLKRMIPGLLGETRGPPAPPRGALYAFGGAFGVFAAIAATPILMRAGDTGGGAQTAPLDTANWRLDGDASTISFSGTYQSNRFEGQFGNWSASIAFDPDRLDESEVTVTVRTASADAGKKLYNDNLRGDEWFDVEDHPVATVRLDGFRATPEGYDADAALTIKAQTVTVPFSFTLDIEGDRARMSGETILERTPLNLGQASDPNAEWVGETVRVDVTLEADRLEN